MRINFFCLLLLVNLAVAQAPGPDTHSGRFMAANFGQWTNTITSVPSASQICLQNQQEVAADGSKFYPWNTNAPLLIGVGTTQETVSPTLFNFTQVPGGVCVSAVFTKTHVAGDQVRSGTFGLQEALNIAGSNGGGAVAIDIRWANLGGTNAMVSAANTPSNTGIEDIRTGVGGGSGSMPTATAAGQVPASIGAGTSYSAFAPGANGLWNSTTPITIGSTNYYGEAHGDNSYPGKICGITGASSYPPVPTTGYGYATIDVCPALFTAPPPLVTGTSSRTIMGINSALATEFPDHFNVFAINGQLVGPPSYSGNQWSWAGVYHESDWQSTGTLNLSVGGEFVNYNSGNGIVSTHVGVYTESVNGQTGGIGGNATATTGTITSNTGLWVKTGVNSSVSGATNTGDTSVLVDIPYVSAGSVFTNGHTGISIADQTNNGALNPANGSIFALKIAGMPSGTDGASVDLGRGVLFLDNKNVFVDGTTSGELNLVRPTTINTGPIGYPNPASSGVCSGGQPCQMLASSNVETAGPGGSGTGAASTDSLWPDSTSHRWLMNNNNVGADYVGDAIVQSCGTTTSCSHSLILKPQIVFGTVALTSGTPSTATVTGISPAFTSSTSFNCTCSDNTTQTNACKAVGASSSSVTMTGANTITDTVSYICVGN